MDVFIMQNILMMILDLFVWNVAKNSICQIMNALKFKKKKDHCKSHVLYSYEKDISCLECEFRYHMKKNNCYKIYSKIENCDLYEDFYNYEFSCLKTENDKIEKEVNSVNFIFYNNLYIYYSYAYYYTNIILNYLFNSGTTLVLSLSVELLFVLSNTFSCLKP